MSEDAVLVGVIGDPIRHSKSPLIHNHWIRAHRLKAIYAPFHVAPESAAEFLDRFRAFGVSGFNVTAPHKETAFAMIERRTESAIRCGSANLVSIDADGQVWADNTDGWGFLKNLEERANWSSAGKRVAFVGAGGAATSVCAALLADGAASIRLANRTQARAEALAGRLGAHFSAPVEIAPWPLAETFFEDADLIVNGATLGMAGSEAFDWPVPQLGPGVVATDLVYAPLVTPFLGAAQTAGATIVDGLGMLIHQARPSFRAWFGVLPEAGDELRRLALEGEGLFS